MGKPGGKRPPGRPRRRWKDNIKMDLQEVGCGVWTGEGQVADTVNVVMKLQVPLNVGNFMTS